MSEAWSSVLMADAWTVLLGISSLSGDVVVWLLGTHTSKETPLLRVFSPYAAKLLHSGIDVASITLNDAAAMRATVDTLIPAIERRWGAMLRSPPPDWIGRVGEPAMPLRSYDYSRQNEGLKSQFSSVISKRK